MNEPPNQDLADRAARGALTAAERAQLDEWLKTHPDEQPAWEEETQLSRMLAGLPDAPLSSNFTARVVHRAERSAARHRRSSSSSTGWRLFGTLAHAWQFGAAVVVVGIALLAHQQYQVWSRTELARSVAKFSPVAELPSVDLLEDFDAILNLPPASAASDDELFSALQ